MSKMQILLIIGAGAISFAGSFGVSWLVQRNQTHEQIAQVAAPPEGAPAAGSGNLGLLEKAGSEPVFGMSEKQLQNLIHEVRSRIQEFKSREKYLQEETERVEIARQGLQEEVERLNALREKVASSIKKLEQQEKELQESIVTVGAIEKTNFQHLASTYDKMDTTSAGRILLTMAAGPQMRDAVKILYYMNERTAAKVLGEIGGTQPDAAAKLSLQLKRVQESE